jgi:small subunit ribosomal protein S24e
MSFHRLHRPIDSNLKFCSDVLHPNRPNVSKDDIRTKLGELYKSNKDSVSVFGFRTQFGGGKSTGFALVYDSNEALKKFEPHYRLVRYDFAKKIEKASRQQRTLIEDCNQTNEQHTNYPYRKATQEQIQRIPRNCQGQGSQEEEGSRVNGKKRCGWCSFALHSCGHELNEMQVYVYSHNHIGGRRTDQSIKEIKSFKKVLFCV